MKKLIAIIFALALVLPSVLCACTDNGGVTESTAAETTLAETVATDVTQGSPILGQALDYKKETVTVAGRKGLEFDYMQVENAAEIMNDATLRRNSVTEETLNVTLEFVMLEAGSAFTDYLRSVEIDITSGEKQYDILSAFAFYSSSLIYSGFLTDLNQVKNLYLDQPYWNQSYNTEGELYGKLYMATGDISLNTIKNTFCIYFNKDLLEDVAAGTDLYAMVDSGMWTASYFFELVQNSYRDENGDQTKDVYDVYGLATSTHSFHIDSLFYGFDMHATVKNDGIPEISLINPLTEEKYNQARKLLYENNGVYLFNYNDYASANNAFIEGRSVFSINKMGVGESYAQELEDEFGIVPLFKFSETQEYTTSVQDSYTVVAIPINLGEERTDRAGAVLEMLAYESSLTTRPSYFEVIMKNRVSGDVNDSRMYDLVLDSVYYDFGIIHSSGIASLANGTNIGWQWLQALRENSSSFVSRYASVSKLINNALGEYMELLEEID